LNKEEILLCQLQAQGFEVFYPRLLEYTKNRNILKIKPLFPRYLFVRVDFDRVALSNFQRMQFANGLASFGEKPVFVPDNLIRAIRHRVEKTNLSFSKLLCGSEDTEETDQHEAIIKGYEGIFSNALSDKERVNALLLALSENAPEVHAVALGG
jgi:transcriptional antiterminator RfaH